MKIKAALKTDIPIHFVHTLDNSVFLLLKNRFKPKSLHICYVNKNISKYQESVLTSKFNLEYINFNRAPGEFFRYHKECYCDIERLFNINEFSNSLRAYIPYFNTTWEHLEVALKKILFNLIEEDLKIIFLGENLFPEKRKIYFLKGKKIVGFIKKDLEITPISHGWKPLARLIKSYAYLIVSIFRFKLKGNDTNISKNGIVFEQEYSYYRNGGNPEFERFYNCFKEHDDVTYICKEKGEIYHTLKKEGKPVVCFRWDIPGLKNKIEVLKVSVLLLLQLIKRNQSVALKGYIMKLKNMELYYQSVFRIYCPKCYLKIRADMDFWHPIATCMMENCNGINIGYQHGCYPGFDNNYSWIDFHIYGIWGEYFRSMIFKEVWDSKISKFPLIGPFTAMPLKPNTKDMSTKTGKKTVGIFTTSSFDDGNIPGTFYKTFLDSCYSVLSGKPFKILLKEKGVMRERDSLEQSLRKKYNLKVERFYSAKLDNFPIGNTNEIINLSHIIIVMSTSSIAWEALSLFKKVIVYETESVEHPFETVLPEIVVRNDIELSKCLERLLYMTQEEYEKAVRPLIDAWAKVNRGQLIREFWDEVESLSCEGN